jgi:Flp pilus assembly protein TadD
VTAFEAAIQLNQNEANHHAGLAKSLIALGKKDEARAALRKLRDIDLDHPEMAPLEKALQP